MSNIDKLKKKAAEFEQKKQFDKALEVYLQIIEQSEGQDDRDVTVYNRVGDLNLRLNKTDQAVNYYEQAVSLHGGWLPQQRHRALQQDSPPRPGAPSDLLQAR